VKVSNKIYPLTLSIILFSACSTKNIKPETKEQNKTVSYNYLGINNTNIKKEITESTTLIEPMETINTIRSIPKEPIETIDTISSIPNEPIETINTISSIPNEPIETINTVRSIPNEPIETINTIRSIPNEPIETINTISSIPNEPIETISSIPSNVISNRIRYTSPVNQVSYDEVQGDFAGNYQLKSFIDMMVNVHNFDRKRLVDIFSKAKNHNYRPIKTDCSSTIVRRNLGQWDRYKNCFIYESNIQRGIHFWKKYRNTLRRAEREYGVPAKYIVGILGVETAYGVNFGKYKVIDVLTTKAMLGDRRASFYTDELEKFLVISRDIGIDPTETMGSTSGALGYGQFMPSSYIRFAVDFNHDGKKDLWNAEDAIGSIANYFAQNGWNRRIKEVAVRAKYRGNRFRKLKTGYKTKYSQYTLRRKYKIVPRKKMRYKGPVSLIKLNRTDYDELWFGTHNFRVITTYNHSALYGMAVYQLGEKVSRRRY